MSIKLTEKKENKLLKRTEVKGTIGFAEKSTPSGEDVAKMIASETKKPAENIVVKGIYTKYGDASADVTAYVYNTKEDKESMEPKTKAMLEKSKKKPAEEKPAAPADKPAETAKEASETKVSERAQKAELSDKKKETPKAEG